MVTSKCTVKKEIQVVQTNTSRISAVQLVYISSNYSGVSSLAVQGVTCDASGGSFRLSFNGYTTSTIAYNANAAAIQKALQALETLTAVTVTFINPIYPYACINQYNLGGGFTVRFDRVVNMAGNVPRITAVTNNLLGMRYVSIHSVNAGEAPVGGTYRLSFRGSVSTAIDPSSLSSISTAILDMDTINPAYVSVSQVAVPPSGSAGYMYAVTFSSSTYGDVEALEVVEYSNLLTGTNIAIAVFADGLETLADRGGYDVPSTRGNEVSGTFVLDYRGYQTDPIDSDASNTQVQIRLEALPNIGTVRVTRTGPSPQKEYVWSVTFLSMPGSFPDGTGDIAVLRTVGANNSTLLGNQSLVNIVQLSQSSKSLGGSFSLTYLTGYNITETAGGIPSDASADDVAFRLNQLQTLGSVSVTRTTREYGYQWLITFDGCKMNNNGSSVCNEGRVALLAAKADYLMAMCSPYPVMDVTNVIIGSGPDESCFNNSMCVGIVPAIPDTQSYSYYLSNLATGIPYYARVLAYNSLGFGYPSLPLPAYAVPSYNPPGAPPPVRLVSSTATTIEVEWSYPRENGGADVMGFQLFVEDWVSGNPRLVFDGIDQPGVTSFTVGTTPLIQNTVAIQPGKNYRFTVLAVNYCIAGNSDIACKSASSVPSVFAARGPRAPLPPAIPYRSSKSMIGSTTQSANITIRWHASIDNGGSPITGYSAWIGAPGSNYQENSIPLGNVTSCASLEKNSSALCSANDNLVLEYTFSNLNKGSVYRFYIVARNVKGKSAASPILSVVAGTLPGMSFTGDLVYSTISPAITAIDSSDVTLAWLMPASNSIGGTPLTGYQVFMFPGVGLNTLSTPVQVFKEVQMISTSVDAQIYSTQSVRFSDTAWTFFSLGQEDGNIGVPIYRGNYNAAIIARNLQTLTYGNSPVVYDLTFSGFTVNFTDPGIQKPLFIFNMLPSSVTNNVTLIQQGTQTLGGSFALSYNNSMTIDLPYDVSAVDMKTALQDLPGVGVVTVQRVAKPIELKMLGAYSWTITFESVPGNIPLLTAYSGRLVPLSSNAALMVSEIVAGSTARLMYDGRSIPEVRSKVISGLSSEMTYAFKILPYNSLGAGVLSAATATVTPRSGASAVYTTAYGSSLVSGITYRVDEQQIITTRNCGNQTLMVGYGATKHNNTFQLNQSTDSLTQLIQLLMQVGTIRVEREDSFENSAYVSRFIVTFVGANAMNLISVTPTRQATLLGCSATVEEFLSGMQNSFIIQPKQVNYFEFYCNLLV